VHDVRPELVEGRTTYSTTCYSIRNRLRPNSFLADQCRRT
jgi:hypothetical protein